MDVMLIDCRSPGFDTCLFCNDVYCGKMCPDFLICLFLFFC